MIPRKMFKKYKAFAAVLAAFCLPGFAGCTASETAKSFVPLAQRVATAQQADETPETARMAVSQETAGGGQTTVLSADATIRDTTYLSDTNSENALRVQAALVTLQRVKVSKTGDVAAAENEALAQNAALLATEGAQLTVRQATVTSASPASAGVYSEGAGTVVELIDSVITTTDNNAKGILATGSGAVEADQLTVTTAGNDSAVLYVSDGGLLDVNGGAYTSGGYGAPVLYAGADVDIRNAELTANNSEALVLDGEQSVTLENCEISGNRNESFLSYEGEIPRTMLIYRPTAGATEQAARLALLGGRLSGNSGDLFYITNTRCELLLHNVTIENSGDGALLRVAGSDAEAGWGTPGQNGAQATVIAEAQQLTGDIVVDTQSQLALRLTEGSTLTGSVQILQSAEESAAEETAVVTIEKGSRWELTADCVISALYNEGEIDYNGYTITLADGTVLSA